MSAVAGCGRGPVPPGLLGADARHLDRFLPLHAESTGKLEPPSCPSLVCGACHHPYLGLPKQSSLPGQLHHRQLIAKKVAS